MLYHSFKGMCSRRQFLCRTLLLICSGLVVHILVQYFTLVETVESVVEELYDPNNQPEPIYLDREKETEYPILVWWTPFVPEKRTLKQCSLGTCIMTKSRTEYDNPLTEGFLFYGTSMEFTDLPLPRKQNHKWFLLHEESPKNHMILRTEPGISLFNYTATFSRYSSFPLVTQHLESIEELLKPVYYKPSEKSKDDIGLVMYIHSDCNVPSDRDSYATELMKYVKVDSYGSCIHNKDLPKHLRDPVSGMDSPDLLKIQGRYKFVLAFENALADDYITEKLWRTFKAGSVPIYKGSPSVMDWAPSNPSIILADDFNSVKDLAKYLQYLDSNDEEYEKYLSYKTEGIKNERLLKHMHNRPYDIDYKDLNRPDMVEGFQCFVCNKIHERRNRIKKGETIPPTIANKTHYHTYQPKPSFDISHLNERKSYIGYDSLRNWMHFYQQGELKAVAIKQAIANGADAKTVKRIANHYQQTHIDW